MREPNRIVIVLYLLLILVGYTARPDHIHAAGCNEFPPSSFEDDPTLVRLEGRYINDAWGYTIEIPRGLVAKSSPPNHPQHGFGILLSRRPKGYIWVNASPNTLEWKSLRQAADAHISWIKEGSANILKIERYRTNLNGFPALRLIVRYECPTRTMIDEYFIAIDSRQIVYTIALSADAEKYSSYKKILAKIARTWQLRGRSGGNSLQGSDSRP